MSLMVAMVVALLAFVLAPGAEAAQKYFSSSFPNLLGSGCTNNGCTGANALGGLFSQTRDIVVNDPSVEDGNGGAFDGWSYVVDEGNSRVQAFDAEHNFKFAIGRDVIVPGGDGNVPGPNEQQTVAIGGAPTGGSFQLRYGGTAAANTSAAIPWNATAGQVETGLETIAALTGNVSVALNAGGDPGGGAAAGGPWTVTFVGSLADTDVVQMTSVATALTPVGSPTKTVTIATTVAGANNPERCTDAPDCKGGLLGTQGGMFDVAQGIDVDQQTGHFFVRERNNNRRVQEFEPDGTFVRAFGWDVVREGTPDDTPTDQFETCFEASDCQGASATGGNNVGQFGSSTTASNGLAVAPPAAANAGEVFAVDPVNRRILRFTVPADPAEPVVHDDEPPIGDASVFSTANTPRDVAVDPNGVVYGSGGATGASSAVRVVRFDPVLGDFLSPILGDIDADVLQRGGIRSMEIDQATGHLFVGRNPAAGIFEFDVSDNPGEVDADRLVSVSAAGLNIGVPEEGTIAAAGIGIDPGAGKLLVSTRGTGAAGSGTGHRVLVLDDSGVEPAPQVLIADPADVGATTATFSAEIDPVLTSAFQTRYRWQVSKTGIEGQWIDVTEEQPVGGDGFTPEQVSATVGDLEANTLYRVRVRTTRNPDAGVKFSAERIFVTDPAPPAVHTLAARHVSDGEARVMGRLNPGGLATDYWFEWGDTDLANQAPLPAAATSGSTARHVGEQLTGLDSERVYSFRLCARNQLAGSKVCGAARTFQTDSPSTVSPTDGRSYEMVLSPDKPLRRGGEKGLRGTDIDYTRLESGIPAVGGGAFRSHLFAGATCPTAGHGANGAWNHEIQRRRPGGSWDCEAIFNVALPTIGSHSLFSFLGESADLSVSAWNLEPSFFPLPSPSRPAVRAMGSGGGPLGAGWYPWLNNDWFADGQYVNINAGGPAITDDGSRLAWQPGLEGWRNVTPADGGPAPQTPLGDAPGNHLVPPQAAGGSVFVSGPEYDWRPGDLVNECTGAGGTATLVPSRDDNGTPQLSHQGLHAGAASTITLLTGTGGVQVGDYIGGGTIPAGAQVSAILNASQLSIAPAVTGSAAGEALAPIVITTGSIPAPLADDTLDVRECAEGSPTDVRGAVIGSRVGGRLGSTAVAAMSEDGRRVFFLSPDPSTAPGQNTCETSLAAVGAGTRCPAQLFVRQYGDDGEPTVRWLSRAEDALFYDGDDPRQHPLAAVGNGVAFEGASRDGRFVFFRTNAPLLDSDPNGGLDRRADASPHSWDLYRYDLGPSLGADPAVGDPGNRLVRVSGGPAGTADPNTNCSAGVACGGAANGHGNVARFVSDDGQRVYFVTVAPIPGAANAPPAGSAAGNVAADAATADPVNGVRNLYLYDAAKSGSAAYEFVARLPIGSEGAANTDLANCATRNGNQSGSPRSIAFTAQAVRILLRGTSCLHGSGSGDAIVFETRAQLTEDDDDAAADVYVYDAVADRLTRLSAPLPGGQPYRCLSTSQLQSDLAVCNGDLGFGTQYDHSQAFSESGLVGGRHWNVAQDSGGHMTEVFFESRQPLVDGAAVNDAMKVYQWHRAGARLSLISPPGSADSAFYAGNGLDGRDVFFWTEERISPWEIDETDGDVYNATRRTDLRSPPSAPPPICSVVQSGSCQGPSAGRVSAPVGSATPTNADSAVKARVSLTVAGVGRAARQRAARSGVLAVRVRSNAAGVVQAVARGRVGRRTTVVGRGRVRATGDRPAIVRIPLSALARRSLRAGRALRVAVRVTKSGARARSVTVTLKRAAR